MNPLNLLEYRLLDKLGLEIACLSLSRNQMNRWDVMPVELRIAVRDRLLGCSNTSAFSRLSDCSQLVQFCFLQSFISWKFISWKHSHCNSILLGVKSRSDFSNFAMTSSMIEWLRTSSCLLQSNLFFIDIIFGHFYLSDLISLV